MFKTRLISGILLAIAALLTIISGNYVLFVTLLCVSLLGMQELIRQWVFTRNRQNSGTGWISWCDSVLCISVAGIERYGTMAILIALI